MRVNYRAEDIVVGVTADGQVRLSFAEQILTCNPMTARWLAHHLSAAAYLIDPTDDDGDGN